MHAVSCWQCELSKEEAVPAGASVQYSPCKRSGHLSACNSEFLNLQVFCARIDEHFLQRSAYSDNSCPCYSGCFLLPPCWPSLYQNAPFFARLFFLQASLTVRLRSIPVLQQGGRKTQRKRDSGTASREGLAESLGTFSSPHLGEQLFIHEVSIWQSFLLKSSLFWEYLSAPMTDCVTLSFLGRTTCSHCFSFVCMSHPK